MPTTVELLMGLTGLVLQKINPFSKKSTQVSAYYGGSMYSGSSQSAGGKWPYSISSPGSGIHLNHKALRQGARVAMQDSAEVRSIIERKVDAIAHIGLKLEPTPDASMLGISQEAAAEWGRNAAHRFSMWAGDKKQHRPETMTFNQAQWLYTFFKERDNDIFVRLYYSPEKTLQNPLQFSFLDPDQIRGHAHTSSYGFQYNHDGIIRDDRGRETAYEIWFKKPDGSFEEAVIKAKGSKSGRIFMLHGWQSEYAGQGRGFTRLAPVLQDFEKFTDFKMAHIQQAVNQAAFVGWHEPSNDEHATDILGSLTSHGAGPAAANFSAESNENNLNAGIGDFACYDLPESTTAQPGSLFIQDLPKGSTIKLASPNTPSASYDAFQKAFLTTLSACAGVPLEVVEMKFANNYSASRATLLIFQRIIEIQREDMVADFNNPIYEMWMSGEIAAGRISAHGWLDPRLRKAWLKATWRGAPVPDIDPGKLAKARETNLIIGATNIEREAQQNSGLSAEDNIAINNRSYGGYETLPFSVVPVAPEEKTEGEKKEDE